jgi:hypothetical protein
MRRAMVITVVLLGIASPPACKGEQVLKDDCPESGKACPSCANDADCVIVSNACSELAYCTHREREPPLAADGATCSSEYDRPPRERCACVEKVCRVR